MLEAIGEQFQILLGLGLDAKEVDALQMALRTALIYAFSLAVIRLGSKRFLSQASAFDVIVAIMIGSVMSRGINGGTGLIPTLAGGSVLVALHWLFAVLAYHMDWFGPLVKGRPVKLIEDGQVQEEAMRGSSLSKNDLEEALRLEGKKPDPSRVQLAYLERDGSISVIPTKPEPRVFTVSVADGVQTIRIELE